MQPNARKHLLAFTVMAALSVTFSASSSASAQPAHSTVTVREVTIVVDGGFTPARVDATAGERLRLRFERRDYGPCTAAVVFRSLGLHRALPSGETTVVDLPALSPGEVRFECAMQMSHGVIVVHPR